MCYVIGHLEAVPSWAESCSVLGAVTGTPRPSTLLLGTQHPRRELLLLRAAGPGT